jgi:hypothetical protein
MTNITTKSRSLAVWISLLALGICGCARHQGLQHLRLKPPCNYDVVDAACYGYYPTCWRAWPEDCGMCVPPGQQLSEIGQPPNMEPIPVPQKKAHPLLELPDAPSPVTPDLHQSSSRTHLLNILQVSLPEILEKSSSGPSWKSSRNSYWSPSRKSCRNLCKTSPKNQKWRPFHRHR